MWDQLVGGETFFVDWLGTRLGYLSFTPRAYKEAGWSSGTARCLCERAWVLGCNLVGRSFTADGVDSECFAGCTLSAVILTNDPSARKSQPPQKEQNGSYKPNHSDCCGCSMYSACLLPRDNGGRQVGPQITCTLVFS